MRVKAKLRPDNEETQASFPIVPAICLRSEVWKTERRTVDTDNGVKGSFVFFLNDREICVFEASEKEKLILERDFFLALV